MISDTALVPKRLGAAVSNSCGADFTVALYAEALSTARMSSRNPTYRALADIDPSGFDTLIIPDGLGNPSRQDYDQLAIETVRHFLVSGKRIVLLG